MRNEDSDSGNQGSNFPQTGQEPLTPSQPLEKGLNENQLPDFEFTPPPPTPPPSEE